MPRVDMAIRAAKIEYESSGYIRPTQVALLQRCFHRARAGRYEMDPLPINVLDIAIAQELDGQPLRMLRGDEIAVAIELLAMPGTHTPEEEEWHGHIQEQLLLTGWLSQEQLAELKNLYLESTRRWMTSKGPAMTDNAESKKDIPRALSDRVRQSIDHYLANIRKPGLQRDVRSVIDSIEKQYRTVGWLSFRQVDLLRRCCLRSNIGNPMGEFSNGPCYGRNAPAGRGRGPLG